MIKFQYGQSNHKHDIIHIQERLTLNSYETRKMRFNKQWPLITEKVDTEGKYWYKEDG